MSVISFRLLNTEEVCCGWAIWELERLLTSGADRDKACRDTRKLLNPCHIGFGVFRELSIRCRIFDTGFIPAREGFKNRLAAIEELNIPAWEAGKGATSTCVTGADLDFFEASKDIEVADMNPCKAINTH
jgi:hypothetical protein